MQTKFLKITCWLLVSFFISINVTAQDTIVIGFGDHYGVQVASSTPQNGQSPIKTLGSEGFLPNMNASSRFLAQATFGYDLDDINNVMAVGQEAWITQQFAIPMATSLTSRVQTYHTNARTALGDPNTGTRSNWWDNAWWNYHMTSNDLLRQKVAMALSQLIVISELSGFGGNPYALSSYYDIMLQNAFTNYRTILQKVTYHPSMGEYLTFLNNPKTNLSLNQFPDENYSREIMQLFTIGTNMLNMDGSVIMDGQNQPVPTYDNEDIFELSKVFTGLTWADRTSFGRTALTSTSYLQDMVMWETFHEPGTKTLLNGFIIPDRNPVNGNADITDALNHLFNHPNVPPFVSLFLIQRLVTDNPSSAYIQDVAQVFVNNGAGVRGDMKAIIKAILLHPEATSCGSGDLPTFGGLREPFARYMQINKAFNASTPSGIYRNDMNNVYNFTGQRPLTSPSVFNFFQRDYQPIGAVEEASKVAPVFQITNAQTVAGYLSGVWEWVLDNNPADEGQLFTGEVSTTYTNQISSFDFTAEKTLVDDDKLHILIDKYNLLLAQGNLTQPTIDIILSAVKQLPNTNDTERERRARFTAYLVMSSPEYLINR